MAYISASSGGTAGSPQLTVLRNDVSATGGRARVTVAHAAVAPTVGVCANGTVPLVTAFSNGQHASAVFPAGANSITVTAPNICSTVLAGPIGPVSLVGNTITSAYAIGTYSSTFKVVPLVIHNNPTE